MSVTPAQPELFDGTPPATPETAPQATETAPEVENVSLTLQDAEMHLIGLKLGNDDPEGERDRLALEMGREALQRLRHVRMWVREFNQGYTAAELAEIADQVEAIGQRGTVSQPEPEEDTLS